MERTVVIHPVFSPQRRILAVSDIHGNLPFFLRLMELIHFTPADILVLVGDLLEKGAHSLPLLRHLMQLSHTHTLYPICGNCDGLVLRFLDTAQLDEGFFANYLPQHPESTLRQMAREGGFDQTEDLPLLRQNLRQAFPREWEWLKKMPTVVETEHLLFVHGGIPALDGIQSLNPWACMKNDNFLGQERSFDKWVIVGHWPVTLYNPSIPAAAPIFLPKQKIISIDGGCTLKVDGQLNALILPSESSQDFTWRWWDGLPTALALDAQAPSTHSVNIRWGRSALELVEAGGETSLCRHLETGRVLPILNQYLRRGPKGLWCEDSTDYRLDVTPGDRLSLVATTKNGHLCKKDGITGWYFGALSDII